MSSDFIKFLFGQTISRLGSSFTSVIFPLLIFHLTGSALNLALSSAAYFLPYLLFGLVIGAWADRANRKRTMIIANIAQAAVVASIPVLALVGRLSVWWIYAVTFVASTLSIFFSTAEFSAIPSLVSDRNSLVIVNSRVQASYSAATVIGPVLAGLLSSFAALPYLVLLDSASFIVSAVMLIRIKTDFNLVSAQPRRHGLLKLLTVGLHYVWDNPILRYLALMVALVNFVSSTVNAQLVLFGKQQLSATTLEIGLLYAAGGTGVVIISLTAGPLRKRWSFSQVALGSLALFGLFTVAISFTREYWVGLVLWGLMYGLTSLFNINTASLRQAITPNELLGRVVSVAQVLAWSVIPVGSLLGGLAIKWAGESAPVFFVIGIMVIGIALGFTFSPVGSAAASAPASAVESVRRL
jgi:MFS family permease